MEWTELTQDLLDKLQGWVSGAVAMLPNLLVAAVIVVAGWVLARLVARLVGSTLDRVSDNKQVVGLAKRAARVAVVVGALFVALGVLHLDKTVTSLLAGVGVVGVALGFAFQDIAANFMAGILMAFRRPIRIGDLIETNDIRGRVVDLDLRATHVETPTGESVLIPNKDVFNSPVINYTRTTRRRLDLSCGVAYDSELPQVRHLALDTLDALPSRQEEREVEFFWTGFGDSSIDFVVRIWLDDATQGTWLLVRSQAIEQLKSRFDEQDIEIPFPIRTLEAGASLTPAARALAT